MIAVASMLYPFESFLLPIDVLKTSNVFSVSNFEISSLSRDPISYVKDGVIANYKNQNELNKLLLEDLS